MFTEIYNNSIIHYYYFIIILNNVYKIIRQYNNLLKNNIQRCKIKNRTQFFLN